MKFMQLINDPDRIGIVCGFSWLRLRCQWVSGYTKPGMNGPQVSFKVTRWVWHFGAY